MDYTDKVKREKEFHNKLYSDNKARNLVSRTYIAVKYAQIRNKKLTKIKNANVLEIGCGLGIKKAKYYISNNCKYVGIDISEICINTNLKNADFEKLSVEYYVDDANNLPKLKGRKFDLIFMSGVLHHLDYEPALITLKNLLSEKGRLIMIEPMGENPFINIFRALTPSIRTIDEHPLLFKDLNYIKSIFPSSRFEFHGITSLLLIPFTFIKNKTFNKYLNKFAIFFGFIDLFISKIPFIKNLSWIVIIEAKQ